MIDFLFPKVYASDGKGISFDQLLSNINSQIVTPIIYLLFALATVYFLYGVFVFIQNAESPEKRSEGGKSILWGLVGMFIMISVKGIINLILRTLTAV